MSTSPSASNWLPRPVAWRCREKPVSRPASASASPSSTPVPIGFKNIEEPVSVWTWEPEGTEARGREHKDHANLPAQYRTAIVGVLPFTNSSESADEYFSDGLTEDLIHALSLQSFYRVLSKTN